MSLSNKQLISAVAFVFFCVSAQAESGTWGSNITWNYNSSNHTITVSGTGAMDDADYFNYPDWFTNLRSSIETVIFEEGITRIGNFAFYQFSNLHSVTIPASVKQIGEVAFSKCSALQSVNFQADSKLESIEGGAFSETGITSISIPASVTAIGNQAFLYCNSLASVTFEGSNKLESIGYSAFYETAISSITIPSSVTSIGNDAFGYCSALKSVTFANDSQLASIAPYVFEYSAITSITIPASVTSIGYTAFNNCTALKSVTFANGSVLESMGYSAFQKTAITSITIPTSVTSIGFNAFKDCSSLTSVTFANGSVLESIGYSAFESSAITSITIPASVTSLGNDAFKNCSSLTSLTFLGPKNFSANISDNSENLTSVYVLTDYLSDYQSFSWPEYVTVRPLSVTLNSAGYATYSAPANLTIATEGVSAYKAHVDGETITLNELNGYIPAGTGVILYKSGGAGTVVKFTGAADDAADVSGNDLQPTTTTTDALVDIDNVSGTIWVLADGNRFYRYTGDTFGVSRAYINYEQPQQQNAPMRMVFADGSTTLVDDVTMPEQKTVKRIENGSLVIIKNGRKYNLVGQEIK